MTREISGKLYSELSEKQKLLGKRGVEMKDNELITALKQLKVEAGSLACLGCGYADHCSTHGCAILRAAVDRISGKVDGK